MKQFFLILGFLFFISCSGKEQIIDNTQDIQRANVQVKQATTQIYKQQEQIKTEAKETKTKVEILDVPPEQETIKQEVIIHQENISTLADMTIGETKKIEKITLIIDKATDEIIKGTAKVEDVNPLWLKTIWLGLVAVVVCAVTFVLWRSGVLRLVGSWLGLVASPAEEGAAKLLAEGKASEATAVLRTQTKFNREYKKQKEAAKKRAS